jgi:hypothetical protein
MDLRKLSLVVLPSLAFPFSFLQADQPQTAETIMSRVAQNQDRAQEMRSACVYDQHLFVRFKRGNGRVCREELREFSVAPTAKGTQKTLKRFQGKYLKEGKLIEYAEPGFHYKDFDLDADIITSMAEDMADDKNSRDGIAAGLFPLTSEEQKRYLFELKGRGTYRGKEVYRISFKPARNGSSDGASWAGEALVDTHAFQPVFITTRLAHGIPLWVKTLLGTDIKQLGFKVEYEKFDEDLWFPVHYGGEFKVTGVFFYKRTMAVALDNRGFQRAQVTTSVTFEQE